MNLRQTCEAGRDIPLECLLRQAPAAGGVSCIRCIRVVYSLRNHTAQGFPLVMQMWLRRGSADFVHVGHVVQTWMRRGSADYVHVGLWYKRGYVGVLQTSCVWGMWCICGCVWAPQTLSCTSRDFSATALWSRECFDLHA